MLVERLREELKVATAAKLNGLDKDAEYKYVTLKNILDTAQKSAKMGKENLSDGHVVRAIKTEINQLKELLKFGRDTEVINIKLSLAEQLLPSQASESEINDFLDADGNNIKNMGDGMKLLKAKFGDALDGKVASAILKGRLNKK